MTVSILLILLSFAILTVGAEILVRGASSVGLRFGLSPLVVGLTIVAFGTSAPELAVSVKAALGGSGDIAIGNVVGSNLFNVAVILGIAALVRPLTVQLQIIRFDLPLMLGASVLFVAFVMFGGGLARWEAGILFAGILAYTTHSVRAARRKPALAPAAAEAALDTLAVPKQPLAVWLSIHMILGGLSLLVCGASLLVDNAVFIARQLEVSEAIIGLTIIAAGTSLPELATSVVAALRRETDIAVGNIVGSNIFNLLCIAGAAGVIAPIPAGGIQTSDLLWMLGISALLLPLMWTGFKIARWEGAALLGAYAVFLYFRWP
ncbi:MAG: cation:H+ antiporter [Verrucomicrobiales bacterium]